LYRIDHEEEGLDYRRRYQGLIGVNSKVPIRDRSILGLVYTPGVAEACLEIVEHPESAFELTSRGNTVAIISDGSDLFGREGGSPERYYRSSRPKASCSKRLPALMLSRLH